MKNKSFSQQYIPVNYPLTFWVHVNFYSQRSGSRGICPVWVVRIYSNSFFRNSWMNCASVTFCYFLLRASCCRSGKFKMGIFMDTGICSSQTQGKIKIIKTLTNESVTSLNKTQLGWKIKWDMNRVSKLSWNVWLRAFNTPTPLLPNLWMASIKQLVFLHSRPLVRTLPVSSNVYKMGHAI